MRRTAQPATREIGARIREARLARKMSQAELAEKAQVGMAHISEIELGKTDLKLQTFIRIIEALQVSADSILRADVPEGNVTFVQEYSELLSDCSPEEVKAIISVTKEIKATFQTHRSDEKWG